MRRDQLFPKPSGYRTAKDHIRKRNFWNEILFREFFYCKKVQTGFMEILDLKVLSERHGYARISVLKQLVHCIHIEKAGKEDL